MYKSIFQRGEDEVVIKKSRFIGYGCPVSTEEEALEFIKEIKDRHRDATHNCSAYIVGEKSEIQRYNDDGEPSGTAGIPILSLLKKESLTNTCVVVTRYFGGIMLGAGGLVRAYTQGAKIAIDKSLIVDMEEFFNVSLSYDYSLHGTMENYLITQKYNFKNFQFTDKVSVEIYVKASELDSFNSDIDNMTSANAKIYIVEKLLLPVREEKVLF